MKINGINKLHSFNYPKRYSMIKFYWDYFMFKFLGIQNLWRLFQVYDSCNGCQLCERICPTNSIKIIDKKLVWSKTRKQCMRCVNFCPKESIYQSQGGDTMGKYKYREPSFKPKQVKNLDLTPWSEADPAVPEAADGHAPVFGPLQCLKFRMREEARLIEESLV